MLGNPNVLIHDGEIISNVEDFTQENTLLTSDEIPTSSTTPLLEPEEQPPATVLPFVPTTDVRLSQPIDPATGRANATFLMLARNSDVHDAVFAIRSLEEQFNGKREHPYPWVFLNDKPFDDEFKVRVSAATKGEVQFGLVDPEAWNQPEWIDDELVKAGKEWMGDYPDRIPYYNSTPYRNMCRFNSGVRQQICVPICFAC